jgi:hypothetical protein
VVDGSDLAGAADDGLLAVGVVDDGNLAAFFEARGAHGMGDRWQRAKSERRVRRFQHFMRFYREERYIHTRDKVLETVGAPQAHSPCHGDGFGGPHCMEWSVPLLHPTHVADVASGAFVRARAQCSAKAHSSSSPPLFHHRFSRRALTPRR